MSDEEVQVGRPDLQLRQMDPLSYPPVTPAGLPADTDAWLAEHVYGVPYSADELWSGQ